MTYTHTDTDLWQIDAEDFPRQGTPDDRLKFLLRYAILAPSVYNTQPWIFSVDGDTIQVFIDTTRWVQSGDKDQRDLYLSVGCALENLLVAAYHFGYRCQVDYFPSPTHPMLAATVRLATGEANISPGADPLFEAILHRSTDHHIFSAEPVPAHTIHQLTGCCTQMGVVLHTTTDRELLRHVDALTLQADAVKFADPAYRKVIAYCIKQGVFDTDWLLTKLSQLAASHLRHSSNQVKEEFQILKGAPVLGILVSETDDLTTQLKVGQVFERIFLASVSLGLRVEPITHVLQVPETRAALAKLPLVHGLIPQILFRLGEAEAEPAHTPRRPAEEVLWESAHVATGR
ncbi:MAG: nitroreductase family protein [Chthonomonadales bacterium]|nr:nitroreductase family protein [Chthonomonadales bacterium]